jgi:hypothetical protein
VLTSEKIILVISLWILVALLVTGDTDFELFFVLIFIGILIVRALSDVFITKPMKLRMNLVIIVFLIGFIVIVGNKIITIVNT